LKRSGRMMPTMSFAAGSPSMSVSSSGKAAVHPCPKSGLISVSEGKD
jgi:hypothetical protein